MGNPIDRTAKAELDLNLVNGVTSDAPKLKANNDVLYDYVDYLNGQLDQHASASVIPHPDGSVTTAKIANSAITSAKIANNAVETAKIVDNAVTSAKIADQAVTSAKIAAGAVTSEKIPSLAITTEKLANGAVTASKLAADARANETINNALIRGLREDLEQRGINVKSFGAVGDGVTDDTQAFIDALSVSDNIIIPEGKTFLIGDVEVSGKTIVGKGIIKKKATSICALKISGSGTVLDGITFEAENTSGQPNWDVKLLDGATDIVIRNCIFRSPTYSAIAGANEDENYINRVKNVLITGNIFSGYARPIFMLYVDNLTISNNIIRDTSYDAIRLRYNDGFTIIDGNQFINIGVNSPDDGQTKDALDVYYSGVNLTISNNIVRVTRSVGFDIKGADPQGNASQKIIVTGNQIYRAGAAGINISGQTDYDGLGSYKFIDGIIVTNNIIQECNQENINGETSTSEAGIYVKGLAKYINISNNYVVSNYARGIHIINIFSGLEANKSIIVSQNMCVNNGYNGQPSSNGIHISGLDGLILVNNICENDFDLPNPYQNVGIYLSSTGGGYAPIKSAIIDKNICRNNLSYQIQIDANNNRANNIASFFGNIQVGPGSVHRPTWQNERSIFFGTSIPSVGDGTFRRGDIIFNVNPSASGNVGWVCVEEGNPGVWKEWGTIES